MKCVDCKHCKSRRTGEISWVYWCGISRVIDRKTGEREIGIKPWRKNRHPKCPLRLKEVEE